MSLQNVPRLALGSVLAALVLLAAAAAFAFRGPPREPVQIILAPGPGATNGEITTYVSGAVRFPGVYQLAAGQRVQDALEAAGGPAEGADLDHLNLAQRLKDGEHVLVPRLGEQSVRGSTPGSRKLNLNTATESELDGLPGIGKLRAQRIIASRGAAGPFREPFELVTRGLVPLGIYQQIKEQVSAP